jgi:hypothetical protein
MSRISEELMPGVYENPRHSPRWRFFVDGMDMDPVNAKWLKGDEQSITEAEQRAYDEKLDKEVELMMNI